MVAGRDEPEPVVKPVKKDGIELLMYPMNPDGSWKNGKKPPKLPKPDAKPRVSRETPFGGIARLRAVEARINDARNNNASGGREPTRKIITIRPPGQEQPRPAVARRRSESPPVDVDAEDIDDDDDDIFDLEEFAPSSFPPSWSSRLRTNLSPSLWYTNRMRENNASQSVVWVRRVGRVRPTSETQNREEN